MHGLTKERAVPPEDIALAIRRHAAFAEDPLKHTYIRPVPRPAQRKKGRHE